MVKFISYDGKYPTLCMGVLTVEIDGKEYKFGHHFENYVYKTNSYSDEVNQKNFDEFWKSGGCVKRNKRYDMWSEKEPWELNESYNNVDENHPQFIIDILPELLKVFNENVEFGCCGGCI